MKTIAICNLKGGVAKTVTTVNLAAILAHDHDKRVLVVDADSQANTTEFFGGDPQHGRLSALLRWGGKNLSRSELFFPSVQYSSIQGVDLIAADDSLMDLDLSSLKSEDVDAAVLRDCFQEDVIAQLYDFCLIDCPPAFNAASAAALLAADAVMIPIKLDAFSLRGMANLLRQISNMRKINPRLQLLGVLPTMWYASEENVKAERTLRESGLRVIGRIPRSVKVDDMTFRQLPLIVSSPRSEACRAYRRLAKRIIAEASGRQIPLHEQIGGDDNG